MGLKRFAAGMLAGLFCAVSIAPSEAAWGRRKKKSSSIREEEEIFQSAATLYREGRSDKVAAIEGFLKFLKRYPKSPRAGAAKFMLGQSNLERALQILKKESSAKKKSKSRLLSPKNPVAEAALAEAAQAFEQVARNHKREGLAPSALYRLGEIAYNRKDYENALQTFKELEEDWGKSYLAADALLGALFSNIALDRFAAADAAYMLLIETYPQYLKNEMLIYAQGILALFRKQFDVAERSFKLLKTPESKYYLGRAYLVSGKPYLAAATFEGLLRDHASSDMAADSMFLIGDAFFKAKDYDGAIAKYERFLGMHSRHRLAVAARFRIGASHFMLKDFARARTQFQYILDRMSSSFYGPLAQYFIAESYLVNNELREALFAYTKVITDFPSAGLVIAKARYKQAWCQSKIGEFTQTLQSCKEFLTHHPTHPLAKNVYLIQGISQMEVGKKNEAVQSLQRIIDLAPTSEIAEEALFLILRTQYELKNFSGILTSYQFIFKHLPPSQSNWRALSYLYAAEAYISLNQVSEARNLYEMILRVYPKSTAALYAQDGLAWCYAYEGDDEAALKARRKLKSLLDASGTAMIGGVNELGIADSLFNQGSYGEANALYSKFAEENRKHPTAPRALYQAGLTHYRQKFYTDAIQTWRKLLRRYPKAPQAKEASFQVADTLFRAGKYNESIAEYKRIYRRYRRDERIPNVHLRIAQAYFQIKKDVKTLEVAKEVVKFHPDKPEAIDALDLIETVLDRRPKWKFQEVYKEIAQANATKPIGGDAQFRLARRYFDMKRYKESAREFQAFSVGHTDHPKLPMAQFLLAESLFQLKDYPKAISAFKRTVNNFGAEENQAIALFHLGSAQSTLERHEEAVKTYRRLLAEFPDSPHAKVSYFNLALSYKALKQWDQAEEAYKQYMNLSGDGDKEGYESALWEVYSVQKEQRDLKAALATLGQLEGSMHGSAAVLEVHYRRGELYWGEGKQEKAIESWEAMRGMNPANSPFRLQAMIKLGEIYEKDEDFERVIPIYEDIGRHGKPNVAQAAKARAEALKRMVAEQGSRPRKKKKRRNRRDSRESSQGPTEEDEELENLPGLGGSN